MCCQRLTKIFASLPKALQFGVQIYIYFGHGQIVLYKFNAMRGNVKMVWWQMTLFVIVTRILSVAKGGNVLNYVTLVIVVSIRAH
jgi:hypothetical protein